MPGIVREGIRSYLDNLKIPTISDVRAEMDEYKKIYESIKRLLDTSTPAFASVEAFPEKICNSEVRSLQTEFLWHGLAYALRTYFPHYLCSRISFCPSVGRVCLDYLEFCHANHGLATSLDVRSRFEQFVNWKESGIESISKTTAQSVVGSRKRFEISSMWRSSSEMFQSAAEKARILSSMAKTHRKMLDRDLLSFYTTEIDAINSANVTHARADMVINSMKHFSRCGINNVKALECLYRNTVRIARLP